MHVDMVKVCADFREIPIRIVFSHFFELDAEIGGNTVREGFPSISGHPHDVILGFVDNVGLLMKFHAFQCSGRCRTLLTPPPSQAGTSRWIREIKVEKSNDPEFPSNSAFGRLGSKEQLATKIVEYCKNKDGYDDVIRLCENVIENSSKNESSDDSDIGLNVGAVYLFKHGKYYKIGKTNDTVRRGNELKIQLPENLDLIHEIKTDDPSGIEAYWHKRFESKRMNGEWFDLNSGDIKTFKRWRKII